MARYRKKPVEIEAVGGLATTGPRSASSSGARHGDDARRHDGRPLSGTSFCGASLPVQAEIFEATYEAVA
jgi:hypothetical protein